jgi:hypothetical protein
MRAEVRSKKQEVGSRMLDVNCRRIILFLLLTSCFLLLSCSIPNLEKPQCAAARQTVREFYSYHFGNDMKPSNENIKLRERFLTDALKQNLAAQADGKTDYFTATDDYPKAFRVGGCEVMNENKTVFEVVLFWKDDARSEQREIKVETIRQNENWLINKVENN